MLLAPLGIETSHTPPRADMAALPHEQVLRRSTPVVINSYNQLTYLKNILSRLSASGFCNLYILDQASSYPPLLSFLSEIAESGKVFCISLPENRGPRYFLESFSYEIFGGAPFIYSDPDISWDTLAPDFMTRLFALGHKHRIQKVGPALAVPGPSEIKEGITIKKKGGQTVPEWEAQFWTREIEPDVYDSPIDTTFHLFIPSYQSRRRNPFTALRVAGAGFPVLHLPWYKTDPMPKEECEHYLSTDTWSAWNR